VESPGETFVNVAEIAPARGGVGSEELIVRAADLLVEREVRRAAEAAVLRVLMKNPAEKKRVIADVGPKQERLLGGRAGQRDQHIGNILALAFRGHVWRAQTAHARKRLEQRRDIIAELPVFDPDVVQDMACENVEIEMRRDLELSRVGKDRIDQSRIIEHGIAGFCVAQEVDQGNMIRLGAGENADDKIEIRRREPRPTIRLDHREPIMSISSAAWQVREFAFSPLVALRPSVGESEIELLTAKSGMKLPNILAARAIAEEKRTALQRLIDNAGGEIRGDMNFDSVWFTCSRGVDVSKRS
jgi:hypothetical protein